MTALQQTRGTWSAFMFGLSLTRAAPQMTRTFRTNSSSAYVELSAASLSALVPTAVLATWAIVDGRWITLGAQFAIGVGILFVAAGLWSHDGRLFDSTGSRIGLAMVLFGSAIGTAAIRFEDFSPLTSHRIDVTLPNVAVLIGLSMLVGSAYAGSHHRRMQLASLYVLAPASIVLVCIAALNATDLDGASRLTVLVYGGPALVLAWACYSIVDRPLVFAEDLELEAGV